MPPVAPIFATGQPTGAVALMLDEFDEPLRAQMVATGLYNVSVIHPQDGLLTLLMNMGASTFRTLVYSHPEFATSAASGLPDASAARAFILIGVAQSAFTWNASDANQLALDQNRVVARFMMIVHRAVEATRDGTGEIVDEGAPLSIVLSDSCESKYKLLYGESIDASMLGNVALLGKLSRGLSTRNLPTVSLANVFSQCDDKSMGEDAFVMDGQGTFRKKQKVSRIGSSAAFLARLELLMSSLVFVAVVAPAPPNVWSGSPDEGVVGGQRYQLSRQGAVRYVNFWKTTIMSRGADSIDKIISLEREMRSKWVDPFRRYCALQCCIMDSVRDYQGVVFAQLASQQRLSEVHPQIKTGGPKGGPKDYSKLPGFDPNQPTAKETSAGDRVCKHFNVQAGCNFGTGCKFAHVCDVRLPNGSACGWKTHNRLGHKKAMEAAARGSAGVAAAAAE